MKNYKDNHITIKINESDYKSLRENIIAYYEADATFVSATHYISQNYGVKLKTIIKSLCTTTDEELFDVFCRSENYAAAASAAMKKREKAAIILKQDFDIDINDPCTKEFAFQLYIICKDFKNYYDFADVLKNLE